MSNIGKRTNNEDAWLINEELGLFIVADGMGGHDKGEVASWFTSQNLEGIVAAMKRGEKDDTFDDLAPDLKFINDDDLLLYAIMRINRRLYEENEKNAEKMAAPAGSAEAEFSALVAKKKRMGTTLVSLLVRGWRAWLAHVGDSRAYRITGESIQLLTHDHTWVAERIQSGEITPEEAKAHEKRNVITRSVGFKKDVEADIEILTVYPPERFLLCSDGLSNVVDEKAMFELGQIPDVRTACERMVGLAVDRGGRDNITAVFVEVSRPGGFKPAGKPVRGPKEFTDL